MPTTSPSPRALPSAYGLQLTGIARTPILAQADSGEWPEVNVVVRSADTPTAGVDRLAEDAATYHLLHGIHVTVTRSPATVEFVIPSGHPVPDSATLAHPYLATPAATLHYWRGHQVFHAGAFVVDDTAWAVVGDRGAGKSTTLAWLATHGVEILTDDLVVVVAGRVLAGPRCVDLRAEAAQRLGIGDYVGVVGDRPRWRHILSCPPKPTRLGGWIYPAWGADTRVERVPVAERLRRHAHNLALRVPPRSGSALLTSASLPSWVWTRPRRWDAMGDGIAALLDHVTAQ